MDDPTNTLIANMTVWNGAIYAAVGRDPGGGRGRIYRSTNGTTWTLVQDGYDWAALNVTVDFYEFGDELFVSTGQEDDPLNTPAEIWKTADGLIWAQTGADGLGNNHCHEFTQFAEFDDQLYVGCLDDSGDGADLFRTADGVIWEEVLDNGFNDDPNNITIWALENFGGYLWAGTFNALGAEVWRSLDGDIWTKFFDYAETHPPSPHYYLINNFIIFDGYLFWAAANEDDGAQIVKRLSDDQLPTSVNGLGDTKNIWLAAAQTATVGNGIYFGTRNETTGGELWYSEDGLTASQIGDDGFGNVDNFALYAVTFNEYLYVGLSTVNNLKGIEIWRRLATSNFNITNHNLPDGTQGQSYSAQVSAASGIGPYTYIVTDGSLPPGLSLNPDTGAISGIPTEAGYFKFTIEATDSRDNTTEKILSISILGATITTATELPQTGADL